MQISRDVAKINNVEKAQTLQSEDMKCVKGFHFIESINILSRHPVGYDVKNILFRNQNNALPVLTEFNTSFVPCVNLQGFYT